MEDASDRRKRLKMMRDEANDAVDTDAGSALLANPLTEQEDSTPVSKAFSFYSDPLGSLQPAATKTLVMHQRTVGQSLADPSDQSKPPQALTAALPRHNPASVPPHQDGLGQGRVAHLQWQGYPGMALPPMMGAPPPVRPPPPRPPPGLPGVAPPGFPEQISPGLPGPPQPGPSSFGRGRQGRGAPGRGNPQQQTTGQARGRGRGRGRGASGSDSIEAYVSPAMLQDPWAKLMQQHLHHMAESEPVPADALEHNASVSGQPGQSLADVFAAAELEAQAIDQGNLSEEGVQDWPWH
ncbi:hypothetical protein WJX82_002671 [Trebouxia sp. C0006]